MDKTPVILVIALLLCVVHAQLTPDVQALANQMMGMRDTTADPCSDFYQYSCGAFVASHPVPNITGPYLSVPAIDNITYGNDALLAKIVNDPWPIVNDLYQACLQPQELVNKELFHFFMNQVKKIDSVDVTSLDEFYSLIVEMANHGAYGFVFPQVYMNDYQEAEIDLFIGGMSLGPDDYSNETLYNDLLSEITAAFELFESSASAQQDAVDVIAIEEFIANSYINSSANNNISVSDLSEATGVNYTTILYAMGILADDATVLTVQDVHYFAQISQVPSKYSSVAIQRFFQWKIYSTFANWNQQLTNCWGNNSEPTTVCSDIMSNSPYPPPWDQPSVCRNFVHYLVQDLVGLIFTYEVVSADVSGSIKNMTTGIQQAFNKSLPSLDWLDSYSLDSVQFKLAHVIQIIGHPNIMDRYENVTTSPNTFYQNIYNVLGATLPFSLYEVTMPFNRSDFEFDPMIVNAFYDPSTNTINFPAGMLESPMFSGSWPKLFQYSRMGVVVGHENTHGFDNQGTYWNAYGLPDDILDNATRANFQVSAQCIANFYSNYVVFGNTTINGNNTLGENIADIGGVKNSFRAYQNFIAQNGAEFKDYQIIPDLTTNQVYFLHYGQTWCSASNVAWLEYQLENDVHSPAKFRVNGPLSQFDEFASAFNCPANKPMNPSPRCDLW